MAADHDALLDALREQAALRRRGLDMDRRARTEIEKLAKRAHAAGRPKLHIAKAAGVSRTALDAMLRR